MRSRPASKKRRGTKSRGGSAPAGRRALWRFDARAGSMEGATLERGDLHACQRERAREREKRLSRLLEGMSGRRAIDCHELGRERSWPAWGERRGSGRRRAEEVWLMRCRTRSGPAAASACEHLDHDHARAATRAWAGQHRGASGAISDCGCGSAAGGATSRNARAVAMVLARLALAKSP